MPYVDEDTRKKLDTQINIIVDLLNNDAVDMTDEQFMRIAGSLNYTFTRIVTKVIKKPSYSKIAITTGVLENIKQEFYRRLASNYEDQKIRENGDIPEYLVTNINKPFY